MHLNTTELIKSIRYRLNDVTRYAKDKGGKVVPLKKKIYSSSKILSAARNAWGLVSSYFDDPLIFDDLMQVLYKCSHPELLVHLITLGACHELLLAQALSECGKEYDYADHAGNVAYCAPKVSEMIFSQALEYHKNLHDILVQPGLFEKVELFKKIELETPVSRPSC